MFFDLRFPSIDPWTDLEELLAPPEQPDAGREQAPEGLAGPVASRPPPRASAAIVRGSPGSDD